MKLPKFTINQNLQIVLIIIITFLLLFATTLLLDIKLISDSYVRKLLIYLFMLIEAFFGFIILKEAVNNLKN